MGKFIDMTGWVMKEHGVPESRLTVIDRAPSKDKHIFWNCICECGTKLTIRGDQLKRGVTKSCGCLQKEIAAQCMAQVGKLNKTKGVPITNYVGQKINMLTLIEPINDGERLKWKCQCECGNYTFVSTSYLNNGHTKSCGCIHSYTEKQLSQFFNKQHLNYSREYTFNDLLSDKYHNLRFDFAIFDESNHLKGLIECQGEQHYIPVDYFGGQAYFNQLTKNDNKKKDYCKAHNIPLLCIRNKNLNLNEIQNYVKEILSI